MSPPVLHGFGETGGGTGVTLCSAAVRDVCAREPGARVSLLLLFCPVSLWTVRTWRVRTSLGATLRTGSRTSPWEPVLLAL